MLTSSGAIKAMLFLMALAVAAFLACARHLPPRYRQGIAGGKGRGRGEEHRDRHTGGNRACGT